MVTDMTDRVDMEKLIRRFMQGEQIYWLARADANEGFTRKDFVRAWNKTIEEFKIRD